MTIKKTDFLKFGENLYEVIPPYPSETDRGGIKASVKSDTDTVEAKIGENGKLYVPEYPSLEGYATEEYVDDSVIALSSSMLLTANENSAAESYSPVADADLTTKEYVDNAVSNAGGTIKTVNGNEPDENGNVEVKSVVDFYELENKPFDCELNLIETIHVYNINGTVKGYIRTNLNDYSHICVEIDDKHFFDIIKDRESGRWGDVDKNLWDNGDGYGFYIEFEDRGVRDCIIYTDANRYGKSLDVKLYEQITKKELNQQASTITVL